MKKTLFVTCALLTLAGCGLAQQQKWATAEAQAEQQWQQCNARFSAGEFTYTEYADCSDKNVVPILESAQHPQASGFRQVNAFRRVLGERIQKKELTKSEAELLDAEYLAKLNAEIKKQEYQRSQAEAISRCPTPQSLVAQSNISTQWGMFGRPMSMAEAAIVSSECKHQNSGLINDGHNESIQKLEKLQQQQQLNDIQSELKEINNCQKFNICF